ncbi:MAG: hypothetical protein PVH77_02040 [Phycisphaerales bacterium]
MFPYFFIYKQNDSWLTQGQASCFVGHKIEAPGSEKPDGIFAQWEWDGSSLRIMNDRYGMFPLFYIHTPTLFGISTSIPELLKCGAPAQLDTEALGVFLRLGHFIKDETPFRYIRAMDSIKNCTWEDGNLVLEKQRPACKHQNISRDQAIEGYIEHFRSAIRKRIIRKYPCLLPLSGGQDSRHILFELLRNGIKPDECLTSNGHPSTSESDVEVAKMLAERFHLSHTVIRLPQPRFKLEQRKNELISFSALEHAWYLSLGDYMRSQNIHTAYEGIGGDILSAGLFVDKNKLGLFRQGKYELLAEHLMPEKKEILLQELIKPDIMKDMKREKAVAKLAEELQNHTYAPNPVSSFYFWNRTRRSIALCPFALCNGVDYLYTPYLDKEVFDFLTSISGDIFVDSTFHRDTISQAFTEYIDIPYASKNTVLVRGKAYYLKYLINLLLFMTHHRNDMLNRGSMKRIIRMLRNSEYRKSMQGFALLTIYLNQISEYINKT